MKPHHIHNIDHIHHKKPKVVHHKIFHSKKIVSTPIQTTDDFDRLASCESGQDATTNTGNGFYGAFQFDLKTWRGLGYSGYPYQFSYIVQKTAAEKLQKQRGWQPWPACTAKLGLA